MKLLEGKRILLVDDTPSIRTFLRISLQARGAQCYEAGTAEEALLMCHSFSPDFIILDLGLPDADGLDVLPKIYKELEHFKTPHVIVLTVRSDQGTQSKAKALGANAFMAKPFMMDELFDVLSKQMHVSV